MSKERVRENVKIFCKSLFGTFVNDCLKKANFAELSSAASEFSYEFTKINHSIFCSTWPRRVKLGIKNLWKGLVVAV